MSAVSTEQNVYAAQFPAMLERLPGSRLPWVRRLRESAMEDFMALGFPTTKLEDWKYTNVAPIRRNMFESAVDRPIASVPESLRLQVESYASPRLVFVNGRFDQGLSAGWLVQKEQFVEQHHPGAPARWLSRHASSTEEGSSARLLSLSEALVNPERAATAERYLGRYAATSETAFTAWNTAFFTDGAYIEIPQGTVVKQPLSLIFVSAGNGQPWVSHPRNLIVAGERSQVDSH